MHETKDTTDNVKQEDVDERTLISCICWDIGFCSFVIVCCPLACPAIFCCAHCFVLMCDDAGGITYCQAQGIVLSELWEMLCLRY